ncbi:MAG: YfhO family protein [Christensenella sp.]
MKQKQITLKTEKWYQSKAFPICVLMAMMLVTIVIVFGQYLTTAKYLLFRDIGTDTVDSYLPSFAEMAHKISGGELNIWDFRSGMGAAFTSAAMPITEPFKALTALLASTFGMTKLPWIMAAMSALRVFCAGLSCYAFLSCFKIDVRAKVLSAYVFSFCGFMMLWGQHYFFASAMVFMPLLLFALEKSFSDKRFLFLTVAAAAVVMLSGVYLGYMIFITSAIYAFIRFFIFNEKCTFKLFAVQILPMIGAALLGMMIACVIILPTVEIMLNVSSRLSGGAPLIDRLLNMLQTTYSPDYMKSFFGRLFSNNLLGIGNYFNINVSSNYYEAIQPFFSLLFILIVPQYIINIFRKKTSVRVKTAKCVGTALIAGAFFLPVMSMILNGFVAPSGRTIFVVLPFFAVIMAITLHDIFKHKLLNKPVLAVTALLSCGALAFLARIQPRIYSSPELAGMGVRMQAYAVAMLVIVIVCAACLWIASLKKTEKTRLLWIVLAVAVMINMAADGYITYNERITWSREEVHEAYNGKLKQAVDYLKQTDDGFYRMERDVVGFTIYLDAGIFDYYGISTYDTAINRYYVEFREKLWQEIWPVQSALQYTAYANDSLNNNLLETITGIKYIVTGKTDYDKDVYEPVKELGNVSVLRNKNMQSMGMFFDKIVSTQEFESLTEDEKDALMREALFTEDETVLIPKTPTADLQLEDAKKTFDTAGSVEVTLDKKTSDITADVSAKSDGVLMLSVPYENGWEIYVDGQKAQLLRVDYAFCGVELTKGEHMVQLRYVLPGLYAGAALSLIGLGILGLWIVLYYKQAKKVKLLADNEAKNSDEV